MPPDELTGGKDAALTPDVAPTGGTITTPTPGEGQGQPEGQGDVREPLIPRERFDDLNNRFQQTEAELTRLRQAVETQGQQRQTGGGQRTWQDLSQEELNSIVSNPTQYPEHFAQALAERDRRVEERLMSKVSETVSVTSLKMAHQEAFDANTPLGREVARIMANRSQADVMKDVIELAEYRHKKGISDKEARDNVANNLKAASVTAPGVGTPAKTEKASYMDMPKEEFEAEMQKVKLGARKE